MSTTTKKKPQINYKHNNIQRRGAAKILNVAIRNGEQNSFNHLGCTPPLNNNDMKEIKDLKTYLDYFDECSRKMSKEQRTELRVIMSSLLKLLVGFKKGTDMGKIKINYIR